MNPSVRAALPGLTADEQTHSAQVAAMIRGHIVRAGGWLPFDEYMDLALYSPGLGYYSAGSVKLGPSGDFVTAPEISDLFSACVARQTAEVLGRSGGSVLELGAGTGRMAAVVLETLHALGTLPERYEILEVSADLRERQRQRVAQLPAALRERVVWLERLPQRPQRGVLLANELLDALPCERFVVREDGVREYGVAVAADGAIVEREAPARPSVAGAIAARLAGLPAPLPAGYRSETCTRIAPWIAGLAASLEQGAVLLFDYGLPRSHYYHPQRHGGTLRCHFRQLAHDDPFANPGLQDITAWVDFTSVAEAAGAAGLEVAGYTTQTAFLLGTGIEALVAAAPDDTTRARRASEARQLLMPGEMGETFKAMALTRNLQAPLGGFAVRDLRALL